MPSSSIISWMLYGRFKPKPIDEKVSEISNIGIQKSDLEMFELHNAYFNDAQKALEYSSQEVKRLNGQAEAALATAVESQQEIDAESATIARLWVDSALTLESVTKTAEKMKIVMNTNIEARSSAVKLWQEIKTRKEAEAEAAAICLENLMAMKNFAERLQANELETLTGGVCSLQHAIAVLQQGMHLATTLAVSSTGVAELESSGALGPENERKRKIDSLSH